MTSHGNVLPVRFARTAMNGLPNPTLSKPNRLHERRELMNTLHTLDEVYEVVKEKSRTHHDEHVPVSSLRFDSLHHLSIGDTKHSLTKQAQQHIANRLRIPHSYLSRCGESLQAENLNTWLDQERNENLFLRFNGNQVRAIFTPRYKPYDHADLIQFLLSNGFEGSREVEYSLDAEMLMLNLITPQERFHV
jgi:hypothetical protein